MRTIYPPPMPQRAAPPPLKYGSDCVENQIRTLMLVNKSKSSRLTNDFDFKEVAKGRMRIFRLVSTIVKSCP